MLDPNEISHKLVSLGEAWADKVAAAEALEDAADAMRAQCFLEARGNVEERKMRALLDEDYKEMKGRARDGRRDATKARVRYDSMRAWIELIRSQESTRRAELTLR